MIKRKTKIDEKWKEIRKEYQKNLEPLEKERIKRQNKLKLLLMLSGLILLVFD